MPMSDLVERLNDLAVQRHRDRGLDAVDDALREAASRISQQDAELERLRREVEEARQVADDRLSDNARLTNEKADALFALAEARKAAFIEAAEIAEAYDTGGYGRQDNMAFCQEVSREIANLIRAKAEETGR